MLSFFPRDALDEIWELVGSVSEGFPSYSYRICAFLVRALPLAYYPKSFKVTLVIEFGGAMPKA